MGDGVVVHCDHGGRRGDHVRHLVSGLAKVATVCFPPRAALPNIRSRLGSIRNGKLRELKKVDYGNAKARRDCALRSLRGGLQASQSSCFSIRVNARFGPTCVASALFKRVS
jgi:hypothetical protein